MAAEDIINSTFDQAVSALNDAASVADVLTSLEPNFSYIPTLLGNVGDINPPLDHVVGFAPDAAPGLSTPTTSLTTPTYDEDVVSGISTFDTYSVPDFEGVMPEITLPSPVSLIEPTAPNQRPELEAIDLPASPVYDIPELPTLAQIVVPDDVNVVLPTFDATFNLTSPTAPTNYFSFAEQSYNSTLLTAALELLEEDITNGGYGLRPEDELNIWNRAKDRISQVTAQEYDEADTNLSTRGFSLPTGAHNSLLQRSTQSRTAQLSQVNNELAIKRADMYVQARQFAITTGLNANQFLMGFHNSVQERALNFSKSTAEIAVLFFNAEVAAFQQGLEHYKTEASVFQTRLQAAREQTEIFRLKLESARIKGQINQDQIEIYLAQYRGVEALINIYNTQLQSTKVKADLQELKFRVYSEDIRAYISQLDANGKRIEQFTALTNAENSKVDLFRAQIQAHNAQLDTVKTKTEISRTKIDSQIETANLKLRGLDSNLNVYSKAYEQEFNNAKLTLDKHGIDIGAWQEKSRIGLNTAQLNLDSYKANTGNTKDIIRLRLDRFRTEAELTLNNFKVILDQVQGGAEIYARLSASAYSALNTIAAIIE